MPIPSVPEALKTADLARFIHRAAQLESIRPVIAYWCEYWVVKNILAKGLHNGDPETLEFTQVLMDKLEQIKAETPDNDAIFDDVAGQAYVEQFSLATFQRADNALRAKRATKLTATTFQAAATFLELVNIWTSPEPEIKAKIKYAKWNAVRITRALNRGEDPNESNSYAETAGHDNSPRLYATETDAQESGETITEPILPIKALPKGLFSLDNEELSHETHSSAKFSTTLNCSEVSNEPKSKKITHVSQVESSPTPYDFSKRNNSNYHEQDTSAASTAQTNPSDRCVIQSNLCFNMQSPQLSSIKLNSQSNLNLESFPSPCLSAAKTTIPEEIHCDYTLPTVISQAQIPDDPHLTHAEEQTKSPAANIHKSTLQTNTIIDDVSICNAQKHARWAISALNFEDTDTAIKELREALKILRAE